MLSALDVFVLLFFFIGEAGLNDVFSRFSLV